MADIFISYARDDQEIARKFRDALAAEGFDVWWDAELRSGETFDEVIDAALRGAKAVVVLWSPRSVASRWVRAEATVAQNQNTLLPVVIEPSERPIVFELVHAADLMRWNGNRADPAWRAFAADVRRFTDGDASAKDESKAPRPSTPALPDKPSVAVLPFTDLGGAGDSYFADGVVEEISTALSRFQTLFVIAGASSLTFRDARPDPVRICRELGVRYLLEGSIRAAGARVRITVKLVDGIAGEQIWAEKFDGGLDDIFELQDRVAGLVAARINSSIDTAELRRAASRPTGSPDAHELYWRANAVYRKLDPTSLKQAIGLCDEVLALEPNNAWAAALAGFCYATLFANGTGEDRMADRTAALGYYERAMRTGGDDARVLGYCGALLTCVAGDMEVATRLIDRTLEINPGSATSLFWGGWNDVIMGRPERAIERLETALRLNPLSVVRPMTLTGIGIARLRLRSFEEAAALLTEAVQQAPHFPAALAGRTAALAHAGRAEDAAAAAQRLRDAGGSWGVVALTRDDELRELMLSGVELADMAAPSRDAAVS